LTFLKLLRYIPINEDISPEMMRKLEAAANRLLAGREGGNADAIDNIPTRSVDYEDRSALEDLTEPELIEREHAEPEAALVRGEYTPRNHVLLTVDEHDREIVIAKGTRREIEDLKASLSMVRVKKGKGACDKEIKKLRNKYLGELYEKSDC